MPSPTGTRPPAVLAEVKRGPGRPTLASVGKAAKLPVTIRLDAETHNALLATGPDWRANASAILRRDLIG